MMDWPFLRDTFIVLLEKVPLTLNLAFMSLGMGGGLGMILAFMRLSGNKVAAALASTYLFVLRGTPLLVQIFLIYYGLGQFRQVLEGLHLWGFFREPYWCAILALTLNTAAYASEIFRGGVLSVPHQAIEAARSCGMSGFVLVRRIVAPLALRNALPAYSNEFILMIKATSLASIITLMEVTGTAAKLIAETFRTIEIFVVAGFIYLSINFVVTRVFMAIEWRLSRHRRNAAKIVTTKVGVVHA